MISRNHVTKPYYSNLVPKKLNWKPQIPLYVEMELEFNQRQSIQSLIDIQKLRDIKH